MLVDFLTDQLEHSHQEADSTSFVLGCIDENLQKGTSSGSGDLVHVTSDK